MTEELERSICEYLDGTLPAEQRSALEARLPSDAEAQAVLAQHRGLSGLLASADPLPQLNWDRLADHLSASIREDEQQPQTYRLPTAGAPWRIFSSMAAAAVIVMGFGLAWLVFMAERGDRVQVARGPTRASVAIVQGPQVERASQPSVCLVAVGPSQASSDDRWIAEAIVDRPARVIWIAAGPTTAQDSPASPY
jgi:anti-sigma factor RsiW